MKSNFTLTFGKAWMLALLLGLIFGQVYAQSAETAPDATTGDTPVSAIILDDITTHPQGTQTPNLPTPAIEAMWDQQFAYNISDSVNSAGNAGCIFLGTEFWVARWASDTLYRLTATGSFIDTLFIMDGANTVSGTRAMTTDGTNIYIANNTTTLYEVNPATWIVNSTISAPLAGNIRFVTYDPTANGGTGGFWVGNFGTDISLITRNGQVITSIPAATHGLGGMYGAAFDNTSTGGPYLWVFHQSNGLSRATISQLQLPSGQFTGRRFDVDAGLGGNDDFLAGGLFITDQLVTGQSTLLGLAQGDPNTLVGLDLDFIPPQIDPAISQVGYVSNPPTQGMTPERLLQPGTFYDPSGIGINYGRTSTAFQIDLDVTKDGVSNDMQSVPTNNLSYLQSELKTFGFIPDGIGEYVSTVSASITGQTDEDLSNNSLSLPKFSITERTLSFDNGEDSGTPLAVSQNNEGFLNAVYNFSSEVYLEGIEIEISDPVDNSGTITYGILTLATAAGPTMGPQFITDTVIINANQNKYFLKFPVPFPASAGSYWGFGVYEGANTTLNLLQADNFLGNNVNFFTTDLNTYAWTAVPFETAMAIRPVLASCFTVDYAITNFNTFFNNQGAIGANVTGGLGTISYQWDDPNNSTTDSISNLAPGTYTVTITDQNSCSVTDTLVVIDQTGIEEDLAAGISKFEVYPNPSQDIFHLNIEMAKIDDIHLTVIDLNGKTVLQTSRNKVLNYQRSLDLSRMSKGIYMLMLTTTQGSTFKRLILD